MSVHRKKKPERNSMIKCSLIQVGDQYDVPDSINKDERVDHYTA
jgi:hypothetical protein